MRDAGAPGRSDMFFWSMGIFFLLLNLQLLTIEGWDYQDIAGNIKAYHVAGVVFFLLFSLFSVFPQPPILVVMFFLSITAVSAYGYAVYQPGALLLNYWVAFLSFYLGMCFGAAVGMSRALFVLRAITAAIFAAIIVKLFVFRNEVMSFYLSPWGHPGVPSIYGGGLNLEATWVSLSTVLFLKTRLFLPYALASLIVSILYASRVGFVAAVVCLIYALMPSVKTKPLRFFLLSGALVGFVFGLVYFFPDLYIIERFMAIGHDPGSAGRLDLWSGILGAFFESPVVGHGAGNAISAVEGATGLQFYVDNVHNYYGQLLLDFGLIGFLCFLSIVLAVAANEISSGFSNPLGAYLMVFFALAFIQFRGAESIMWFIFGLYVICRRNEEKSTAPNFFLSRLLFAKWKIY